MNRTSKLLPPRSPSPPLVEQYRAIGPAALLAALICQPRPRLAGGASGGQKAEFYRGLPLPDALRPATQLMIRQSTTISRGGANRNT